jgi:hypothetical protein
MLHDAPFESQQQGLSKGTSLAKIGHVFVVL